jgi:hypothetical protein
MALLREDQVSAIADQFKATGFTVGNYGGGSAETYHYNTSGTMQNTTINKTAQPSQNLVGKIAAVGRETFGIAESGAKWAGHYIHDTPGALYNGVRPFLKGVANVATGNLSHDLVNIEKQRKVLDASQASYTRAYQAGKMSKDNYSRAMESLAKDYQALSGQSQNVASQANKGDVVEGALNTTIDILTVGKLQVGGASPVLAARASLGSRVTEGVSAKVLAKGVASDTSKTGLKTMIDQHAAGLEKIVTKLPVVRNLLLRNTQSLAKLGIKQMAGETASQFLLRESKNITVGLLIKRPLFYQLNIDSAHDVYDDMLSGKYGSAAVTAGLQATQLLEGPFSAVVRAVKAGSGKIRDLSYGVDSVIDKLSREIGTGEADQVARFVQAGEEVISKTGKTKMSAEQVYRLIQENNLRGNDENADSAVSAILRNYQLAGRDLSKVTAKEIAEDYINWQEAADIAKHLGMKGVKGINAEDVKNLVVVRWDSIAKRGAYNRAIQAIRDNGGAVNIQHLTDAVFDSEAPDAIGNAWRNNTLLAAQVTKILKKFSETGDLADLRSILSIPTAYAIPKNVPARIAKRLTDLGYGIAVPKGGVRKSAYAAVDDTRKLISNVTLEATTTTKTTPVEIPGRLKQLADESKGYASQEEFLAAKRAETTTQYEDVAREVEKTQNAAPLKHFTDAQVAEKLAKGEKFNYDEAPLHGVGSKQYGSKVERFVDDGKPTMYLSLDDAKWNVAHIATNKPTDVIENFTADEMKDLTAKGYTFSYDYDKQKYIALKDAYETKALTGVNYYVDQNATKLTIDSVAKLQQVAKEVGKQPDDPGFWAALRAKYDVVNIVNVDKNASPNGLGKWFSAAKGDQSIILNTDKVSTEPFKSVESTIEKVGKTVPKQFNEADAKKAYGLARAEPEVETQTLNGSEALFDAATAPQPTLAHLAGYLAKVGLSPQANQQQAFKALSSGVVHSLDSLGVAGKLGIHQTGQQTTGGQVILSKLEQFVTDMEPSTALRTATLTFGKARPAVTDIRQLTSKEIKTALNVGNKGELITDAEVKENP